MIKRKQIIVNPKIQFKLIALVVCSALIPIMLLFVGFMLYSAGLLARIPDDNPELLRIVEAVQFLNLMTFGGFIFILVIVVVVEILFLHKIVGPLYRIETEIEAMLKTNDLSKRIQIRQKDYLHSLVEKINALIDRFHQRS
jgi:methyl-accepting chemotaxis protein